MTQAITHEAIEAAEAAVQVMVVTRLRQALGSEANPYAWTPS